MKEQLLYRDLARFYDLIYSWKDYAKEVKRINQIIKQYKRSQGKDLLEVGCGSGKHLQQFKKTFRCVGTDLNKDILAIGKKKVKGVTFKQADMITMKLGEQFDVITSLFSAIGYVKTYANLKKTIQTLADHLKPRGVLLIEPWFTKEAFKPGRPHMTTYEDDTIKIARAAYSTVKGNRSLMEMHYLIAEKGKGVKYFSDLHDMGLFSVEKTLQYLKASGLKAKFLRNGLSKGRGLYVAIKS